MTDRQVSGAQRIKRYSAAKVARVVARQFEFGFVEPAPHFSGRVARMVAKQKGGPL